jgi:hypothetical protein
VQGRDEFLVSLQSPASSLAVKKKKCESKEQRLQEVESKASKENQEN